MKMRLLVATPSTQGSDRHLDHLDPCLGSGQQGEVMEEIMTQPLCRELDIFDISKDQLEQIQNLSHRQSAAYDFDSYNNSLIMVGGELCTDKIWCNNYTNKTLISNDGGTSFKELSPFPALLKNHCAVFLDNETLMVIGGYKFPISYPNTYLLDINTNSWRSGPSLTTRRSYHTCNIVTNCEGKQQVVVVGGVSRGVTGYLKSVEIYDVDSGTWSAGNYLQ